MRGVSHTDADAVAPAAIKIHSDPTSDQLMAGRDSRSHAPQINVALVRRLIAEQFPEWAALPITPVTPGGWDNRMFRLGDTMAARLPSGAAYAEQPEKEYRWLPRLASHLPLAVQEPLALGKPSDDYRWRWTVTRWLDGEAATPARIDDMAAFATTLAQFLVQLQQIDTSGGPTPGEHNFFRGASPAVYDRETRDAIDALDGRIDSRPIVAVWEAALNVPWQSPARWLHGDVSADNLLVQRGRLCAAIDFGCCGVGDPACDLTIAWTLFAGDSRDAFKSGIPADAAMWARARGWALWKALTQLAEWIDDAAKAAAARRVIEEVVRDHVSGS